MAEGTDKALEPSIKTGKMKHQVPGLSFKNANGIWGAGGVMELNFSVYLTEAL